MKKTRLRISCSLALLLFSACFGLAVHAQTPAPAAPAAAAPAPVTAADAELKDAAGKAPTMLRTAEGRSRRHDHRNHQRRSGGRFQGRRHASRRSQPGRPEQDRRQLRLDAGHGLPGHVHAGRLRHGGIGPVPREKRQPHVHDELLRVHLRFVRLLDSWLCHTDGRGRRQRQPGRPAVPDRRTRGHRSSARRGACSGQSGMFLAATPTTSA